MSLWYCHQCVLTNGKDCGPWDDDSNLFPRIRQFHQGHSGWMRGVPEPSLQELANEWLRQHYDELFHNVVAWCKPDKVCLLKDKWRWISQA